AVDPQGRNLYVAYQCSGGGGTPGHDAVEVFDVHNEVLSWTIQGQDLPIVGSQPWVSPDGQFVLVDGGDACTQKYYDHKGCVEAGKPWVPGNVGHLVRSSDRKRIWTFEFPLENGPGGYLDNSRFLVLGKPVSVVRAKKYSAVSSYSELERWDAGEAMGPAAF